jgi:antitoxin VapB
MPMSIKNPEVERLAEELSRLTKSSKTEVIRQALREKKERLEVAGPAAQRQRLLAFLQNRVWPKLPKGASRRWTRKQEERLLGYGEHGEPI